VTGVFRPTNRTASNLRLNVNNPGFRNVNFWPVGGKPIWKPIRGLVDGGSDLLLVKPCLIPWTPRLRCCHWTVFSRQHELCHLPVMISEAPLPMASWPYLSGQHGWSFFSGIHCHMYNRYPIVWNCALGQSQITSITLKICRFFYQVYVSAQHPCCLAEWIWWYENSPEPWQFISKEGWIPVFLKYLSVAAVRTTAWAHIKAIAEQVGGCSSQRQRLKTSIYCSFSGLEPLTITRKVCL